MNSDSKKNNRVPIIYQYIVNEIAVTPIILIEMTLDQPEAFNVRKRKKNTFTFSLGAN